LLDNATISPTRPLHFYDKCSVHNETLSPAINHLRRHYCRHCADSGWLEEMYHEIMQRLLHTHQGVLREVESMPALRAATRDELYRRIYRLADYINACYAQPLTLAGMAQVATLSPSHLLRVFKRHFRQSPHQFLRAKRIDAAKQLLIQSDLPVTEVCLAVGFESLGSFSWRFHREVGLSPQQFRAAHHRRSPN
jgi:AraC-like DNA-binding protein